MDLAELRRLVGSILEAEEAEPVNWQLVGREIDEVYARLAAEPDTVVPEVLDHYLADADIRERDEAYGRRQRDEVRHFIETGEYMDSRPIPGWACLLTAGLLLGLIIWAVF